MKPEYGVTTSKPLYGVAAGPNKFQGAASLEQLEDYGLKRPTEVVSFTQRNTKAELQVKTVREAVQRPWDKKRKARAEAYSRYIEQVEYDGEKGGTPALTLWTPVRLNVEEGALQIPLNFILTSIDGDTQTEARFVLAERRAETKTRPVAVTVYHGVGETSARQILHDYNYYANPISETKLAVFNHEGPMSVTIETALKNVGLDLSSVNRNAMGTGKKYVFNYRQLMHAVVGLSVGSDALKANGSTWFDELNYPNKDNVINGTTAQNLASIIRSASLDNVARIAPPMVWQCAGVRFSAFNGAINWSEGVAAYKRTLVKGRGGRRLPVAERLSVIANAM